MAATTSPADHQTEPQKAAIIQKNLFPLSAENQTIIQTVRLQKNDTIMHLKVASVRAHHQIGNRMVIKTPAAVFLADHHPARKKALVRATNHIPAAHQITIKAAVLAAVVLVIRNHFHQKANLIAAGQQAMIARQEQEASVKMSHRARKEVTRLKATNHIQADQIMMIALQEVLAKASHQAKKEATRQKAIDLFQADLAVTSVRQDLLAKANHQQRKEVMRQKAIDHTVKINSVQTGLHHLIALKEQIAGHHAKVVLNAMPSL